MFQGNNFHGTSALSDALPILTRKLNSKNEQVDQFGDACGFHREAGGF